MNNIILKIKNILVDLKGNFIEEKQPEKVKLPYKMKKNKDGFYYYMKFDLSPDVVANFRDRIKLIEGIIRITISLIVVRKEKIKNKKNKKVEEGVQVTTENIEEKKGQELSESENINIEEEKTNQ
jgi:ribosomal protein S6